MRDERMDTLLIVDDERNIVELVELYARQAGFNTLRAYDGETALQTIERESPALVILDLMLPKVSGWDVCKRVRARNDLPIIMLTARDDDIDKIVGLEVGADDYVTKPFNPRELLARVKSLLRRTGARRGGGEDEEIFRFGGWTLNLPRRRLCDPQGADVALTRGEFEVLALLVRHVGEVINRDRLSRAISGHDWAPQDRTVDVLVRRLRAKLDAADKPDSLTTTVRGEGYRLAVDVERAQG